MLQDNIGDLSNAPEPIQIKLFSPDAALLDQIAPRVATEIGKVDGVVDIENGIDNTISGPATNFEVNPQLATRLGFTTQEVAEDATVDSRRRRGAESAHQQWPPLHDSRAAGR